MNTDDDRDEFGEVGWALLKTFRYNCGLFERWPGRLTEYCGAWNS
jgi:hypothetical protein